jgi:autotransporter-associated beta strand protein/T5SS/PEP-CTERM-associated repeat protein
MNTSMMSVRDRVGGRMVSQDSAFMGAKAKAPAPPPRFLALAAVSLLLVASESRVSRADTTLDSGTTTVTTGTTFDGTLFVGDSGTATLAILGGGSAAIGSSYLGYNAGSKGTVVVNGGTWNSLAVYPAGYEMSVGWAGEGALDVVDGVVTTEWMSIGHRAGGKGSVTITSGTLYDWGLTQIGDAGVGALTVNGGYFVSNFGCDLGFHSGTGALSITGGTAVMNDLTIGSGGTGSLNLAGGNLETYALTRISKGTATVSSGRWFGSNGLFVGFGPLTQGEMTISGGEVVQQGGFSIGGDGGVGVVTVTGGTLATFQGPTPSGQVSVSSGTLVVDGGRVVSNTVYVHIADAVVSSGTWENAGDLIVGYAYPGVGVGTLAVTGGLFVSGTGFTSGTTHLGGSPSGVGIGVISGGTWANGGDVKVGAIGTGTLTMTGGVFSVAGTLSTGSLGTINLNVGGTLQIGAGGTTGVLGVSTLANNGTLIFNRSDASTYSGVLSGSGGLTKDGGGMLTLTGSNGLTGPTAIRQGNLNLANPAALASSAITPLAGGTLTLAPYLSTTVGGLAPNAGGLTDAGSGMVTVAAGLSATNMIAAIVTGMGDGSWNGTSGITSSVAAASGGDRTVGWLDNGDGSVTFAFAAAGDTNLDWKVDILDAANFLSGGKFDSGSPASWNEGDFTYDGVVDILDAAAFLSNGLFDAGTYNPPPPQAPIAVPEPSTFALALAGVACGMFSMWRRRKRA